MYHGSLGGISIAPETSTYGTPGTYVPQHGISSGLKFNEQRTQPPTLGGSDGLRPHVGIRTAQHVAGPVVLGLTRERDEMAAVYGHFCTLAGQTYPIYPETGGPTPTHDSIAVRAHYGDDSVSYSYTGCVARSITWDLKGGGEFSTVSLDLIGRGVSQTAVAPGTLPPAAELVHTTGLAVVTGDTTLGFLKSAQIRFERNTTGPERQTFGGLAMAKPLISVERPKITATFTVEHDSHTETALGLFLAGTTAGEMTIGDFAMTGCQPIGQIPDLGRGYIEVTFTVEATSLIVTTVDA